MPDFGNTTVFSQTDANNNTGTMPSWLGTAAPSTLDDAGRALQGASTREWNWRNYTLSAGGTANAKTLTYSVAPEAYYNGQRFAFVANTTNTGAVTLNVNSLGAKNLRKDGSGVLTDLAAGDMSSGMYVEVCYQTSGDVFVWTNQKAQLTLPVSSDTVQGIVELATTSEVLTGTDATRAVTPDSVAALWEQGTDVASASIVTLGEGGYFVITGATTITDIDFATDRAGRRAWLRFSGALTLTHNATTLILPGGANITTAAGDVAEFVSEGSDVVRCVSYTRADGPYYGARAWVNFNGTGTVAIRSSANVSSITDNGIGLYTVNFSKAMPDANYSVVATNSVLSALNGSTTDTSAGNGGRIYSCFMSVSQETPPTTTAVRVAQGAGYYAGDAFDPHQVHVVIFR